jgi:outer membrane protein OmpU
VAFAGAASADIALSGSAQMGIQGGDLNSGASFAAGTWGSSATTQFVQDIDITFTMSGTSDNGLTFGAAIDLDENAANVGTDDAGVAIFVSGDFGTLTLGDTDGALDWAMQEVDFRGAASINDDHTAHLGFNGNSGLDGWYDGQILRYDYSFGDFAVAISVEQDDNSTALGYGAAFFDAVALAGIPTANNPADTADPIWAIGGRYAGTFAGGTFGVGIGYQWTNDGFDLAATPDVEASVLGVSANVALDSGFAAAINYSVIEFGSAAALGADIDGTHFGIGASYTFDAITVHANYGEYNWDAPFSILDTSGYGLSASYSFGGGLSAHLGYGYSEITPAAAAFLGTADDAQTWSFGLNMAF